MTKRILAICLAICMMVIVLAGCGNSTANNSTSSSSPETVKEETNAATESEQKNLDPITMITPWEFTQEVMDAFKAQTGVEVKQDVIPGADAYKNARNARMAAGEDLDIIGMDASDARDFAGKNYLMDLSNEAFWNNISSAAAKALKDLFGGKSYGVCYETIALGVWYNKDIFAKYNLVPPTNFEEFITICDTLKANGIAPMVQGGKDVWPLDQQLRLATNAAAQLFPDWQKSLDEGTVKWTDKAMIDLFTERLKVISTPGYYAQGLLSTTYDQCWQIILQQKAAMWIMGSWAVEVMTKSNVKPDFEVGAFTAPNNAKGQEQIMVGDTYTKMFGILENSTNKDNAKAFLAFMTQPEIAEKQIAKTLMISNVTGVKAAAVPAGADWAKILTLPLGNTYNFKDEVGKVIYNLLPNIVAGKMTVEEYLAEMQKAQDKDNAAAKK